MMKLLFFCLFLTPFALADSRITVSGISAGAYMAQQLHVAHAAQVAGAGIIAGGPLFCAQGKIADAINRCMLAVLPIPLAKDALAAADRFHQEGLVDDPRLLATSRVYVLSGTRDEIVSPKVGEVLAESYRAWGTQLLFENKLAVGHAFPTLDFGNPCGTGAQTPYISKCNRDVAGEILNHLLGELKPRTSFDRTHFFTFSQLPSNGEKRSELLSMAETGYAYIPAGCNDPDVGGCQIHVSFHGCKQSVPEIKTDYITKTGLNEWAQANRIVILYPQVIAQPRTNPNACWDWWGYSGALYATKKGPQIKRVMEIVDAFRSGVLELRQVTL